MPRLLILCCALWCCGFTVITPEMVRDHQRLCARIRQHYGEKNLTAFVKDVIAKHPQIETAKLADSKVGEAWVTVECGPGAHLASADWEFRVKAEKKRNPDFDKFTLFWLCDKDHGVTLEGHREKNGALILDSISRHEVVLFNWR